MPVEINKDFELAYEYVTSSKKSIFLTGKAGTGKTTFLKHLVSNCKKNLVIAAPTGVAAINAGGVTLHSLFGLPFQPFIPGRRGWGDAGIVLDRNDLLHKVRYNKDKIALIRNLELLIIDEISMVRADIMDAIDTVLQVYRRNNKPFGGVQLLMIGDLAQLPPVIKNEEWKFLKEYYQSVYFFDSHAIKKAQPVCIELETIYRQKEQEFISVLNSIRSGNISYDELDLLNSRLLTPPEDCIILTTHNATADRLNAEEFAAIKEKQVTLNAEIDGDFPPHLYPVDRELVLKKGAKVMFTKNDTAQEKRYFNGKIGEVIFIDEEDDQIHIQCGVHDVVILERHVWQNKTFKSDPESNQIIENVIGTFEQFPLRYAWAITIHKSQGLTFEQVAIDAARSFANGQLYVALSRCTSLEGLYLISPVTSSALIMDPSIQIFTDNLNNDKAYDDINQAQQEYLQELIMNYFHFNHEARLITQLQDKVQEYREKINQEDSNLMNELQSNIIELQDTGEKFCAQLERLFQQDSRGIILERVKSANAYYIPKVNNIFYQVDSLKITIDIKTAAREMEAIMDEFQRLLELKLHFYKRFTILDISDILNIKSSFITQRPQLKFYREKSIGQSMKTDHPELYLALNNFRSDLAEQNDVSNYMIFSSATLLELVNYLPLKLEDLGCINGMGNAKIAQMGEDILHIIQRYCAQNELESKIELHPKYLKSQEKKEKEKKKQAEKVTKEKTGLSTTVNHTIDLWNDGMNVEQISRHRSLTMDTIYNHLSQAVAKDKLGVNGLIEKLELGPALAIVMEHKGADLNTLFKEGSGQIPYGKLRLAIAIFAQQELM